MIKSYMYLAYIFRILNRWTASCPNHQRDFYPNPNGVLAHLENEESKAFSKLMQNPGGMNNTWLLK